MATLSQEQRTHTDPLVEYREIHERQQDRLREAFADRSFMEAALEEIKREERGDNAGTITLEEFKRRYGIPA